MTPPLVMKLGTQDHFPTPAEEEKWLPRLKNIMKQANYRSNYLLPGFVDLDTLKSLRQTPEDWSTELGYLDENIGRGLFFPSSLLKSRGSELATSTTIDRQHLRFVSLVRLMITDMWERFYENTLLPANGIEGEEVTFKWPGLKEDTMLEVARAVNLARQAGAFTKLGEIKGILDNVFAGLNHDQDDKTIDDTPRGAVGGGQAGTTAGGLDHS